MRKRLISTFSAAGLAAAVLTAALPAFSCGINFSPSKLVVAPGVETPVTVTVVLEHRNCEKSIEDTAIEGKNVTIVKKGAWRRVKADVYSLDMVVVLNGTKGELRLIRECEKEGISEGILKITSK